MCCAVGSLLETTGRPAEDVGPHTQFRPTLKPTGYSHPPELSDVSPPVSVPAGAPTGGPALLA
jgi:hypothetical protein